METTIADNTFAHACYDQNSIEELEVALAGEPDEGDMRAWGLTSDEWREQIETALAARRNAEPPRVRAGLPV